MTLQSLLESGNRPVITAEMPSIDGGGLDRFRGALAELAPHVDAINATDNPAAHAHASNVAIAIAIHQAGAEPIMQVVCRDKNRLAIQADIMGAQILARAGYDPREMANMFKTLEAEGGGGGPEWLSDHPNPGNRYEAISKEAAVLQVQAE